MKRSETLITCVPGLLGGAEDFTELFNFKHDVKVSVYKPSSNNVKKDNSEIDYSVNADEISRFLDSQNHEKSYFIGFSLGGKVIYDFAIKYPERFLGAVITDMGPGRIEKSSYYQFIENFVNNIDLQLPWEDFKTELDTKIPNRLLRSLVRSQLLFVQDGPRTWKTGTQKFIELMNEKEVGDRIGEIEKLDEKFVEQGAFFHILQSLEFSCIDPTTKPRLDKLRCMRFYPVTDGTHFLHISHKQVIQPILRMMLMSH